MGGKCCTDRKEARPASIKAPGAAAAGKGRQSVSASNVYTNNKSHSIGFHTKGNDAEKFDKAFEKQDLKAFVELLDSTQPIETLEEPMHPWAEDPKTVGALAGTQFAILASAAEKSNPAVKDDIRKAGAIPKLVEFLKSGEKDRIETAVVALSFLTADCSANARATQEAGGMKYLLQHLESDVAGMRAAAATTLRNMCMEGDSVRKEFVELGGIRGLVMQVSSDTSDAVLNHADVQLEAVLNLQDIIEREDGSVIAEYAAEAVKAGAVERLKKLCLTEDDELQNSAEELLSCLEKHAD
eukprot:TRINITY_DN35965_c1_g1_i1.p1 TRINITY_DN35965_c1_g1~~TRINITY_DN35965_c1_g1_i1.p1  ORF type:complete len:298 (+),score=51.68 TRINITY_DN35965_c1_g1_i1:94-987(+)